MTHPQIIVVTYHYIRPIDLERWGGLHPLQSDEFERQLDFLESVGRIIRPSEIRDFSGSGHGIILTFDDGTLDHHEVVFPTLRRRGISGLFGIISGPWVSGEMPNVHIIHWLTSQKRDEEIWQAMVGRFSERSLGDIEAARGTYPRDGLWRARVKYSLNFALALDEATEFLHRQISEMGWSCERLISQWYVNRDHICEMAEKGMEFAVHAHRHVAYQGPPEGFLDCEVVPCERYLTDLLGQVPVDYIAAFGGTNAKGESVIELEPVLKRRGYRAAYLTQRGVQAVGASDFFIKRMDAVDLPPRKPADELISLLG